MRFWASLRVADQAQERPKQEAPRIGLQGPPPCFRPGSQGSAGTGGRRQLLCTLVPRPVQRLSLPERARPFEQGQAGAGPRPGSPWRQNRESLQQPPHPRHCLSLLQHADPWASSQPLGPETEALGWPLGSCIIHLFPFSDSTGFFPLCPEIHSVFFDLKRCTRSTTFILLKATRLLNSSFIQDS